MTSFILFDNIEVRDAKALAEYAAEAPAIVERYRGEYAVLGGPTEVLEGNWAPTFPVLLAFPTAALARAWYSSPEYAPLKRRRLGAVRSSAVLLEGVNRNR